MTKVQGNFYAVRKGRNPGIYENEKVFKVQIQDFSGAEYQDCQTWQEAKEFIFGTKDNPTSVHLLPVSRTCLDDDGDCPDGKNQEQHHLNKKGIREEVMIITEEVTPMEESSKKRKKGKEDQNRETKKNKKSHWSSSRKLKQ